LRAEQQRNKGLVMKSYLIMGFAALSLIAAAMAIQVDRPSPAEIPKKTPPPVVDRARTPEAKQAPAEVVDRGADFEKRAAQIALVLEDIRAEREHLDGLRAELDRERKALIAAAGERQQSEPPPAGPHAPTRIEKRGVDKDETDNIERLARKYDALPAEKAAESIQQLADRGELDLATRIVAAMSDAQAAKVLIEVPDPALAAQILERIRSRKKPAAATPIVPIGEMR
jgi:flagellar motility protein MotE (MotC chaperone)